MSRLTATDALFKYADSAVAPMNMGSVLILRKPPGYRGDALADIRAFVASRIDRVPKLRMRLVDDGVGLPSWVECADFDLDRHIRRTRLRGSDERELFRKLGRLQHTPFDMTQPLFMFYLVEGLRGDRIALMAKYHHALADGKTSMRLVRLFSDEGEPGGATAAAEPQRVQGRPARVLAGLAEDATRTWRSLPGAAAALRAAAGSAGLDMMRRLRERPHTVFNGRLSPGRQFAFRSMPLAPWTALRRELGLTFVDLGLVLLGGAVRRYLDEIDALPSQSLVCNVPVALDSGNERSGNAVLAMWVRLGTDLADAAERVSFVKADADASKQYLAAIVRAAGEGGGIALPSWMTRVAALGMGSEALSRINPPPGNIALSSVPTSDRTLHMAGFTIESMYGMPMVLPGQGVSVTVSAYAGQVVMSIMCCERALPEPERLLDYMRDEMQALAPRKQARTRRTGR